MVAIHLLVFREVNSSVYRRNICEDGKLSDEIVVQMGQKFVAVLDDDH